MRLLSAFASVVAVAVTVAAQQDLTVGRAAGSPPRLAPTAHPAVPFDLSSMWYAPAASALTPALQGFVRGVKLLEDGSNAAAALPLVSAPELHNTQLADYARYYTGLALLALKRYDAADAVFAELTAREIEGHLPEDSAFRRAEGREGQKDFAGAAAIYESLVTRKLTQPQAAWLKLGLAADQANNRVRAIDALQHAFYDYPLSTESEAAGLALTRLGVTIDASNAAREYERGEALFRARRFSAARVAYERVREFMVGFERERRDLHLAACLVLSGHHREGRDGVKPSLDGALADEAAYYHLVATRGLGLKTEHAGLVRAMVEKFPNSPWTEEALNGLASALIIDDKDDEANTVFREYFARFPTGRYAERAAWKAGWFAYRRGNFEEARRTFDVGASGFPRSDYRPSWLYWSGRASQKLGDVESSVARLKLAATDYHNSYYGRLALKQLGGQRGGAVQPTLLRAALEAPAPSIPTASRIALLLATGLNREAMGELQYAQRMWGDSPQLQATVAFAEQRLGNVRAGINAMKRAYPQYLAAGGETLPKEILQVIFPVEYWPMLQKYSHARSLDPFLVAALVAQESNFDPVVKSSANAIGLMQVLPSTGRAYARRLGIMPFSARRLTDAEVNIRIGTNIFSDSIRKFGGVYFALAAYNAGDGRVVAWQKERPGMPQDEFIDDIPFPETQNYVKRILGTAEDYRYLYR